MSLRVYWLRGEKIVLAKKLKVSPAYISDALCGRKKVSAEQAERIEKVAADMGIFLSANDLMFPLVSTNPLMNTASARKARG